MVDINVATLLYPPNTNVEYKEFTDPIAESYYRRSLRLRTEYIQKKAQAERSMRTDPNARANLRDVIICYEQKINLLEMQANRREGASRVRFIGGLLKHLF